jgi:DNA repair photolyase
MARDQAAAVIVSITTLDAQLARLEPRASSPRNGSTRSGHSYKRTFPWGECCADRSGLTDAETPAIVHAAAQAGAQFAGHTIVRLPYGVADLFVQWLETYYPERKEKVLNKIRSMRQGKLNNARWHHRMRGEGLFAETIHAMFMLACRKASLAQKAPSFPLRRFADRAQHPVKPVSDADATFLLMCD